MPRSAPLSLAPRAARASGSALRRRQVVRRPHDLAGAGGLPAPRMSGALPSSDFRCIRPGSRRDARGRAPPRRARSRCCSFRGHATSSPHSTLIQPLVARARRARHVEAVPGCRPLLSRAGPHRTEGPGSQKRTVGAPLPTGSHRWSITLRTEARHRSLARSGRDQLSSASAGNHQEQSQSFRETFQEPSRPQRTRHRQQCSTVSLAGV